jgi:hypothetical protein
MTTLDIVVSVLVVLGFVYIIIAGMRRVSYKEQWLEILSMMRPPIKE